MCRWKSVNKTLPADFTNSLNTKVYRLMLQAYRDHIAERELEGIPPKPLDAQQVADLIELIKNPPAGEEEYLIELLTQQVPAGVDEAAYVKAGFLAAITKG